VTIQFTFNDKHPKHPINETSNKVIERKKRCRRGE
jgi:hypothetical protein